jgi:hypothetical protein
MFDFRVLATRTYREHYGDSCCVSILVAGYRCYFPLLRNGCITAEINSQSKHRSAEKGKSQQIEIEKKRACSVWGSNMKAIELSQKRTPKYRETVPLY